MEELEQSQITSPGEPENYVPLRLEIGEQWEVKDLVEFLQLLHLTNAYFIMFLQVTNAPVDRWTSRSDPFGETSAEKRAKILAEVWPDDDLSVSSIHIASPGWIEIIGKANPLTFVKDVIVLIRDWRLDRERLALENRHLQIRNMLEENRVIKERLDILRKNGFGEGDIKSILMSYLGSPIKEMQPYVQTKMVIDATIGPSIEERRLLSE